MFNVTHSGLLLFEGYPHKITLFEYYPQKVK